MFKSNFMIKFTILTITCQSLLCYIINISNNCLLRIVMVGNSDFNIAITKVNSAASYIILIRCVASDWFGSNIIELLRFSLVPNNFTSYQILNAVFTKVFSLGNSWLSGLAIFKLVINSWRYCILTVNLLRAVNKVNVVSLILFIIMIEDNIFTICFVSG